MHCKEKIKCYDDMLYAYNKANKAIIRNSSKEMHETKTAGITILADLFKSYKDEKKFKILPPNNPTQKEDFNFFAKPLLSFGNKPHSHHEPKNYFKSVKKSVKSQKDILKQQFQDALKIQAEVFQGFKDLKVDMYEDDEQLLTLNFGQQIKQKGIEEIIKESGKKITCSPQNLTTNDSENVSEYEMSNYSSNQSSNNGDYEQNYKYEEEFEPLFPGLGEKSKTFSEATTQLFSKFPLPASQNDFGKPKVLKFKTFMTDMLKSPKKTPQNKKKQKRLYIGKKKVPKWAENTNNLDLNEVDEGTNLFGLCKVEHLDTNIIFKVFGKDIIERTSSAKWTPYMFQV